MNNYSLTNIDQTAEDQAINRRISQSLNSWEWGDAESPARVANRKDYSLTMTGARVGFATAAKYLNK